MKRFARKYATGMFMAFTTIATIPLGIWLVRPHPLSASSIAELTELVHNSRQDKVLTQMSKRYEAMSLNFEGPDPGADPDVRWQEIETSMQQSGAAPSEAQQVIQAAQAKLKREWPCFAERGYLQGQPVWLVVGSLPRNTGFIAWICPPSAEDIRRERTKRYCTNIRVTVVSAQPPHQILD